jgi:acyl carrier protein
MTVDKSIIFSAIEKIASNFKTRNIDKIKMTSNLSVDLYFDRIDLMKLILELQTTMDFEMDMDYIDDLIWKMTDKELTVDYLIKTIKKI